MASGINGMNFVESVTERDIDFLVLEELQVSHQFRDWFSARVFERPVFKSHIGAWHSVVDAEFGESDLIFMFNAEDGSTKAILIENKISAAPRPDQGKRYTLRGEKGLANEDWQDFMTCLIAPRDYIRSPGQTQTYDCQISYEEVMAYFVSRRSIEDRHSFRAKMMIDAVKQNRRGYQPIINSQTTEFVTRYWLYAQANYPSLTMPKPKPRPAGSTWIYFFPVGFPKSVDVVHQLTAGYVKAFFKQKAADFEAIKARYQDMSSLLPGLEVELTGKSVALSIPVELINPMEDFEAAKAGVAAALETMSKLVQELTSRGLPS
jgi:hypothetical protein